MGWRSWTTLSLPLALVSTCVGTSSFCELTDTMQFGSENTIVWLGANDPQLLEDIVVHNDTAAAVCGGRNPT
jgi:hypothetical protein